MLWTLRMAAAVGIGPCWKFGGLMTAATEKVLSDQERILSLAAVISTSIGVGISFGVGFPLTALTLRSWDQPGWIIGLAGAAPAIAILLTLPWLSKLLSRVGSVRAIGSGCLAGSFGFLALYEFQSPWCWIAIRLLMSAAFALPWLAGETWINAVARPEWRGRVIAVYAMSFFFGFAVGPQLLQAVGTVGASPFLVSAAITALSAVPILVGNRLAPDLADKETSDLRAAFLLAPAALPAAFMGGLAEITCLSLIANVALAAGWSQEPALTLLTITTLGGIVLQFPIGWLSDKTSRIQLLKYLGFACAALCALLPWALSTAAAAYILMFVIGGVILGFYSLGLAIVGERVPPTKLGAANAAFIIMYQSGAVLGPLISGMAMSVSPIYGFTATLVGLALVSVFALFFFEKREGSSTDPTSNQRR
jgi:MFS family permease